MSTATAPIKVDSQADRLISDVAHFLGRSKKDIVSVAIREYVDAHRDEINAAITASMHRLDGTNVAAVQMLTGLSEERLNELGGVPED